MAPLSAALNAAMSSGHLVKRFTELPLHELKAWSDRVPFKMGALGLVTLLGADQVSTAIGSLQRRRYTGALPLLAAFILAGDRFTSIEPGFTLYNVTDGITTTNMSGWFTRWLMCQRTNDATTVFEWRRRQAAPYTWRTRMIAMAISCSLVMPLIICTGLMGDWYGVANAGAIVVTIAARLYILGQHRYARDRSIMPERDRDQKKEIVCIIMRSDGKMATMRTTRSTLSGIVKSYPVPRPHFYHLVKQAAWIALGAHLLVLGMCTLVTQVYTVFLLVSSTVTISLDYSTDTQHKKITPRDDWRKGRITTMPFNDDWDVIKTDPVREGHTAGNYQNLDKRQVAWAKLELSRQEEFRMVSWQLLPDMDDNPSWWESHRALQDEFAVEHRRNCDSQSPPPSSDIDLQVMRPSVQPPEHSKTPVVGLHW